VNREIQFWSGFKNSVAVRGQGVVEPRASVLDCGISPPLPERFNKAVAVI
jgi:hypothetical protein